MPQNLDSQNSHPSFISSWLLQLERCRAGVSIPISSEDELLTIRVFSNQGEFLLARYALESADVECFSKDEHTMRISSGVHRFHATSSTALQDCKRSMEDALAILDAPPLDENYVIEE